MRKPLSYAQKALAQRNALLYFNVRTEKDNRYMSASATPEPALQPAETAAENMPEKGRLRESQPENAKK